MVVFFSQKIPSLNCIKRARNAHISSYDELSREMKKKKKEQKNIVVVVFDRQAERSSPFNAESSFASRSRCLIQINRNTREKNKFLRLPSFFHLVRFVGPKCAYVTHQMVNWKCTILSLKTEKKSSLSHFSILPVCCLAAFSVFQCEKESRALRYACKCNGASAYSHSQPRKGDFFQYLWNK